MLERKNVQIRILENKDRLNAEIHYTILTFIQTIQIGLFPEMCYTLHNTN